MKFACQLKRIDKESFHIVLKNIIKLSIFTATFQNSINLLKTTLKIPIKVPYILKLLKGIDLLQKISINSTKLECIKRF